MGAALPLRLTALLLLLRPMGSWGVRPLILAVAAAALLSPRVLTAQATWFALAALVALRVAVDWPLPDNHVYLLGYWCLAAALALGATDVEAVLSRSSRLLVGCAFLMAILWKGVLSPDYIDGRFFRVTLLTDERFEGIVQLLGGLTAQQLGANRAALQPLPEGAALLNPATLVEPSSFRALVAACTWGALLLEALVAVSCLWPLGARAAVWRCLGLLAFCIATYAVAPVAGFGWLLLTMGIAMQRPGEPDLRVPYLVTWFLVLLYAEIPWASIAAEWLAAR